MRELYYLLYIASLLNGRLENFWKRAARIIISSIVKKELIDELGFDVIVQRGIEEGFLEKQGNSIVMTSTGSTHLKIVESELKFKDEVKYQVLRIRDFEENTKREEYINELEEELKNTLEYFQEKRKVPLPENILVNAYIGEITGKGWTLFITGREYVTKENFSAKGTLISRIIKKIKELGYICYPLYPLGYKKVQLILDKKPDNRIYQILEEEGFKVVDTPEEVDIGSLKNFDSLVLQLITDFLRRKKLFKVGKKLKFIDFSARENKSVKIGDIQTFLTIYHGFSIRIQRLAKGKFILWIDPVYVQYYTLNNWIEAEGIEEEQVLKKLKKIRVLPSKREVVIEKVRINEQIPENIIEYWKNKYRLELTTRRGMATVKFATGESYSYPLETLCLEKEWIEKNIGFIIKEEVTLSPHQRYMKTIDFFTKYFSQNIKTGLCEIKFYKNLLTLKELLKWFKGAYRLLPPMLLFSKRDLSKKSTDTRAIFKFGGYAGPRKIFIYKVICPQSTGSEDLTYFMENLKRTYDTSFGTLDYTPINEIRIPYSEKVLRESAAKITEFFRRRLEPIRPRKIDDYRVMALVVELNKKHIAYYIIKKIINDQWRIPDQHLREVTLRRIKKSELPLAKGLALQLYIKSLGFEDPPWILRYPSDGMAMTAYCGIGYSVRVNDNLKKALGILAICDAHGKYILQRSMLLSEIANYLTRELLTKLFSFIFERTKSLPPFNRIVIYKKGHLTDNERRNVEKVVSTLKETQFWKDKIIDVISVEESIIRLYKIRNRKIVNIDPGTVVVINEKEGLICTSGHPELGIKQGTVKLIHLKIEYKESKKSVNELLQEYYDRTFLNWMSPLMLSRYPPELNISLKLAEISKEVDLDKELTYMVV